MEIRLTHGEFKKSAGRLRRVFDYAFYDWTREMPRWKRGLTWAGILIQGYAVYAGMTRSLIWPVLWPHGPVLYPIVSLLYLLGNSLMNGMLTSEFVRKTQLETDQVAARQIQQTLIPQALDEVSGYYVETFYQPFRDVGGDYFDVISLPGNRTLFALADVSGKGMAAALLSANIQALVRSIANVDPEPMNLAKQINQHLSRYTPNDRFATAVFVVLGRDSGELSYVNAGHNPPMLRTAGATAVLEATGIPLGVLSDVEYQTRRAVISPGDTLLLFTDGLTDSMPTQNPETQLTEVLAQSCGQTMRELRALINPKLKQDDVTILLVRRRGSPSTDR